MEKFTEEDKITLKKEISISNNSPETIIKKYKIHNKDFLHIGTSHYYYDPKMDFRPIFNEINKFSPEAILFEMTPEDCKEMKKMSSKERNGSEKME